MRREGQMLQHNIVGTADQMAVRQLEVRQTGNAEPGLFAGAP